MDKITKSENNFLELMSDALEVKALLDITINVFKSEDFKKLDYFQIATLLFVTKEKLQKLINKFDSEDMKKIN